MQQNIGSVSRSRDTHGVLATNKVLKNTYLLLSMTLIFSAFTSWVAVGMGAPSMGLFSLVVIYGLMFGINATKNSPLGIVLVFAFTGFLGFTSAPLINAVLQLSNGSQIVTSSLGLTGAIFLSLSVYALTTKKDFSYMGGFLLSAMVVIVVGSLIGFFFTSPILHIAISSMMVLVASGLILFDTSRIINGGETNYIMATVSLYLSIYNLFMSLLQLLAMFSGRND
ncbi:MAG: Bax inhibitor-1/YccA family protein [Francisellaceae bacterium]|jgi:modulator of FtsH protease|nr:Bax inhibitor-1/YccA family protein [Francisellaceae bacterium]MBT6206511.1 Bax inhibitor-1/YccA family protein [Francisellaceae bacterium]MBT6539399.1 Bax inhibitor-1/YccA family protein [Francisellaceae bacterium]